MSINKGNKETVEYNGLKFPAWVASMAFGVFVLMLAITFFTGHRITFNPFGWVKTEVYNDVVNFRVKHSNSGILSCDNYCGMKKWDGWSGTCVSAQYVQGNKTGEYTSCSFVPGEGNNLQCLCSTINEQG